MSLTRRSFLKGAVVGLGGAVATAAYADWDGRYLVVEQHTLRLQNWTKHGLRVALLTDIHVNDVEATDRAERAAIMVAGMNPDIVLFGGDAVDYDRDSGHANIRRVMKPLSKLSCPKVGVLGNHDYWSGNPQAVRDALTDSGFEVLANEVVRFDGFNIAGYDDRIGGKKDPMFQPDILNTIALMHEPDDVEVVPPTVSLQISGHSHGGQLCLPFGIALHTPKGARKYKKGFYPDANVPLYVSRGVGTVGPKWRMFCPPEVSLLTLNGA